MSERAPFKTYSRLGPRSEPPSEYELVSSQLHYYVGRGFEVNVPLRAWYERYQQQSLLQCRDFEAFFDPRRTTYPEYTRTRKQAELELDALCGPPQGNAAGRELRGDWAVTLARALPPLRFAFHGFHMIASYIGQMAPSGRVTMAALFQAADEQRRIERITLRMHQLRQCWPAWRDDGRADWQSAGAWQPLREAVEHLLIAYDWGEAFVGLNLCLKPVLDELTLRCLADACEAEHDHVDAAVLGKLYADCRYQQEWSAALVRTVIAADTDQHAVIARWVALWSRRVYSALDALAALPAFPRDAATRVRGFHAELLGELGLVPGAERG